MTCGGLWQLKAGRFLGIANEQLLPVQAQIVPGLAFQRLDRSAIDELRADGLDVEAYFVEGVAADVIYETAASTRANLIVMSTHGHGGLGRWLFSWAAEMRQRLRMNRAAMTVFFIVISLSGTQHSPFIGLH